MKSSPPANTAGLLAWLCLVCAPVLAEPVTLTAIEGGSVLEGDLISSENGILTLETGVGTFQIPAATVTCEGPGCPPVAADAPPERDDAAPGLRIVGADIT
ncbi:MAG: hypothetical protein AAFY59_16415, partial [Pseudomonadota bacterium]